MQATTDQEDAPPIMKNAGKLYTNGDVDVLWALTNWMLMLGAVALIVCIAVGRWRMGLVIYVLVGLALEGLYEWDGWTYSGSAMLSHAEAVNLTLEGLPQRCIGWAQTGAVAAALGVAIRLVVLGVRRLRRPT